MGKMKEAAMEHQQVDEAMWKERQNAAVALFLDLHAPHLTDHFNELVKGTK